MAKTDAMETALWHALGTLQAVELNATAQTRDLIAAEIERIYRLLATHGDPVSPGDEPKA
jgi:hypothetical protein